MTRKLAWLVAASLALGACARDVTPGGGGEEPDPGTERAVAIYGAVVREILRDGLEHQVIYVLDRPVEGIGSADGPTRELAPFAEDVRSRLQQALAELAPVEFVTDGSSVRGPESEGSRVQNDGVLVTLGPVPDGAGKVEVEASAYWGNLAATWLTYVVERAEDAWKVTGTTGPVAIS